MLGGKECVWLWWELKRSRSVCSGLSKEEQDAFSCVFTRDLSFKVNSLSLCHLVIDVFYFYQCLEVPVISDESTSLTPRKPS